MQKIARMTQKIARRIRRKRTIRRRPSQRLLGLARNGGSVFLWIVCGESIPELSGTGVFASPLHNLAIRANSQTGLAGNGDSYLYRSRSLSHWIDPADGTRPQPMPTDQNHFAVSSCFSERNGNTEASQAQTELIGLPVPPPLANSLFEAAPICGFVRNVRCHNIAVNRDHHLVLVTVGRHARQPASSAALGTLSFFVACRVPTARLRSQKEAKHEFCQAHRLRPAIISRPRTDHLSITPCR